MTDKKIPLSVQFFDNMPIIEEYLNRRFPVKTIWEKLRAEQKYTGDYTHFSRLVKNEFSGKRAPNKQERKTTPKSSATLKEPKPSPKQKTETVATVEDDDDDGPLMFMNDLVPRK